MLIHNPSSNHANAAGTETMMRFIQRLQEHRRRILMNGIEGSIAMNQGVISNCFFVLKLLLRRDVEASAIQIGIVKNCLELVYNSIIRQVGLTGSTFWKGENKYFEN